MDETTNRASDEVRLSRLRDEWIAAENARVAVYKAFMDANRDSPLAKELVAAEQIEKRAKDAYAKALQKQQKDDR
ncbi:hypothetical protein J2766_001069 [Agrobacterium tumefaciens]|uniref:Uncharacterized protein n=1 Tax=Agrobacterium tumefaciens TaxID=358 RepID=A0AAW8LSP4_AGRTU|nr:hypothetical protein [Agrobacterium tumefaciens]MBP2564510.1 hypothetical protein [Agrobacterium tumefaciens]MDR6701625.1 hypothetical protein [Agrobacterium tumefaciens]